jgi:hypothetical protein
MRLQSPSPRGWCATGPRDSSQPEWWAGRNNPRSTAPGRPPPAEPSTPGRWEPPSARRTRPSCRTLPVQPDVAQAAGPVLPDPIAPRRGGRRRQTVGLLNRVGEGLCQPSCPCTAPGVERSQTDGPRRELMESILGWNRFRLEASSNPRGDKDER